MRQFLFAVLAVIMPIALTSVYAADDVAKKTVEAVNMEMKQLSGKTVQVQGKVVKVNNGIMKRNFIHIEDGTGSGKTAKVFVTSNQTAEVGNEVIATGTVKLDTDFGMGYFYPLLIENSTIKIVK